MEQLTSEATLAERLELARALWRDGRLEEAWLRLAELLQAAPSVPVVPFEMARLAKQCGQLEMAERCYLRAVELAPSSFEIHFNLANLYFQQGRVAEAADSYRAALGINPEDAEAQYSLGVILEDLGQLTGAVACFRRAIALDPGQSSPRFYLAMHQLAQGNFAEGWLNFEHRWASPQFVIQRRSFTQPIWRGEPLEGRRILLWAEQGLGDTMQFVRYVDKLLERGAVEVLIDVQSALRRLIISSFAGRPVRVLGAGEAPAEFDWQCPLMSLPLAFATTLESIPGEVGYLRPASELVTQWAPRVAAEGLRVGLAWAGNPFYRREAQRGIAVERLLRLARIEGLRLYSLQKGSGAEPLRALGEGSGIVDLEARQQDFADSAALAANLDLVISVDTSVAHMAGGMGMPLWLLLHHQPDWRWLGSRADSPWYPQARLFRQSSAGDWDGVLGRVEEALRELVRQRTNSSS